MEGGSGEFQNGVSRGAIASWGFFFSFRIVSGGWYERGFGARVVCLIKEFFREADFGYWKVR